MQIRSIYHCTAGNQIRAFQNRSLLLYWLSYPLQLSLASCTLHSATDTSCTYCLTCQCRCTVDNENWIIKKLIYVIGAHAVCSRCSQTAHGNVGCSPREAVVGRRSGFIFYTLSLSSCMVLCSTWIILWFHIRTLVAYTPEYSAVIVMFRMSPWSYIGWSILQHMNLRFQRNLVPQCPDEKIGAYIPETHNIRRPLVLLVKEIVTIKSVIQSINLF
jgi:hypothetical protein